MTCSRCSEIRLLSRDAVVGDNLIIMQSKVSAEKLVPIDSDIARVLDGLGDRYLFPSPTNGDRPIGRTWVHNQLTDIGDELGFNPPKDDERSPKITTHTFRRSRCTHLYQGGMTPAAICRLSGHKSVAQLMDYIGIAEQETATQAKQIDKALFPDGF